MEAFDGAGLVNHGAALTPDARFLGVATFTSDVKLHEAGFDRQGAWTRLRKVMDLKLHKGQVTVLQSRTWGLQGSTLSCE